MRFVICTQVWILLGNEEVRERADGEGQLAQRATKNFTHFLTTQIYTSQYSSTEAFLTAVMLSRLS